MELSKRKNKLSKYPFARTKIGGTFEIDKSDVQSMKIAMKAYNKRHGEDFDIDYEATASGAILVTRINPQLV
jgi:hypothetical protein